MSFPGKLAPFLPLGGTPLAVPACKSGEYNPPPSVPHMDGKRAAPLCSGGAALFCLPPSTYKKAKCRAPAGTRHFTFQERNGTPFARVREPQGLAEPGGIGSSVRTGVYCTPNSRSP